MRLVFSLGVVVGMLAWAHVAQAVPITWTINVGFADGGMATGSFVYDADLDTYSSINIVTTGGALPGATYVVDNNAFGFLSTANNMMALTGLPVVFGDSALWMGYSAPLTNAGGALSFNFFQETGCSLVNGGLCQAFGGGLPTRATQGGQLVGRVPEPTTLLLLGTGLAAVGYRRRRKQN